MQGGNLESLETLQRKAFAGSALDRAGHLGEADEPIGGEAGAAGPPPLLICEMPNSTPERPVYAVQPWQPLLAKTKREEYTSGSP